MGNSLSIDSYLDQHACSGRNITWQYVKHSHLPEPYSSCPHVTEILRAHGCKQGTCIMSVFDREFARYKWRDWDGLGDPYEGEEPENTTRMPVVDLGKKYGTHRWPKDKDGKERPFRRLVKKEMKVNGTERTGGKRTMVAGGERGNSIPFGVKTYVEFEHSGTITLPRYSTRNVVEDAKSKKELLVRLHKSLDSQLPVHPRPRTQTKTRHEPRQRYPWVPADGQISHSEQRLGMSFPFPFPSDQQHISPFNRARYCRLVYSKPGLERLYPSVPEHPGGPPHMDCSYEAYENVPKHAPNIGKSFQRAPKSTRQSVRQLVRLDDWTGDKAEELVPYSDGSQIPISMPGAEADDRHHQTSPKVIDTIVILTVFVALAILVLGVCMLKRTWWRLVRRTVGEPSRPSADEWDARAEEEMVTDDSGFVKPLRELVPLFTDFKHRTQYDEIAHQMAESTSQIELLEEKAGLKKELDTLWEKGVTAAKWKEEQSVQ